jgi:hypothetical protein
MTPAHFRKLVGRALLGAALAGCAALPGDADRGRALALERARLAGGHVADRALYDHLDALVARIEPDARTRRALLVVRGGEPRAELLPDGTLRLWTALLLRVGDESELAFVLAHELAHGQLGHFEQRAHAADWEPLRAEIEADQHALETLALRGWRRGAGHSLLGALRAEFVVARDPRLRDALAEIDLRLPGLPASTAPADVADDPWRMLSRARRTAWAGDDPGIREPARAAVIARHAGPW